MTSKANEIFEKMKKSFLDKMSEEDKDRYAKFGEKFYQSFDVNTGGPISDPNKIEICMEESLAYVVESLKSGLHPSYLNEDETTLLRAGYGEEWYKNWGYQKKDLDKK